MQAYSSPICIDESLRLSPVSARFGQPTGSGPETPPKGRFTTPLKRQKLRGSRRSKNLPKIMPVSKRNHVSKGLFPVEIAAERPRK